MYDLTRLYQALIREDIEEERAREILAFVDVNGQTPLHFAVRRQEKVVVSLFLSKGSHFGQDCEGLTPLHWAVYYGYKDIVALFLDLDRDCALNMSSTNFGTAMHIAVNKSNVEIFMMLLKSGANIHAKNISNKSPWDLIKEDRSFARKLLEGADKNGFPALHSAVMRGNYNRKNHLRNYTHIIKARSLLTCHIRLVNLLKGANGTSAQTAYVNAYDIEGYTPLHLAAAQRDHEATKLLLDAGAKPNLVDAKGRTAMHLAVVADHKKENDQVAGYRSVVSNLLLHGANPNAKDKEGHSVLDIVESILDGPNKVETERMNEIVASISSSPYELIGEKMVEIMAMLTEWKDRNAIALDALLELGKEVVQNQSGVPQGGAHNTNQELFKLIQIGANNGLIEHLREVLEYKKDITLKQWVNMKNREGQTPLCKAVSMGRENIAGCLLGAQADPNLPNSAGKTPLGLAEKLDYKEIMRELEGYGALPQLTVRPNMFNLGHFASRQKDEVCTKDPTTEPAAKCRRLEKKGDAPRAHARHY